MISNNEKPKFNLRLKRDNFWEKRTHLSKNPKFCQKRLFFAIKKKNMLMTIWKHVKENMNDSGIWTLNLAYLTTLPSHLCITPSANESADIVLRVRRNFRKRKKLLYWIEYFRIEKFFRRKIKRNRPNMKSVFKF